jgi:hypothetical protein
MHRYVYKYYLCVGLKCTENENGLESRVRPTLRMRRLAKILIIFCLCNVAILCPELVYHFLANMNDKVFGLANSFHSCT